MDEQKDNVIITMIKAHKKFGDDITRKNYHSFVKGTDKASMHYLEKYYKTFNNAKKEILNIKGKRYKYTIEECEKAYEKISRLNNNRPITFDYYNEMRNDDMPSAKTISRQLGFRKMRTGNGKNNHNIENAYEDLPEFCQLCRFVDNCEYNYNLKECPYYES